MIKLELWEDHGWMPAIRGMRNPMNSWDKSDSKIINSTLEPREIAPGVEVMEHVPCEPYVSVGEKDHELMMNLREAGTDHRKYMRMIIVWVDITAPLYWWKEFDTYKVGTVANSCSTMHKIHAKEFTLDDFSHERLFKTTYSKRRPIDRLQDTIDELNYWREQYLAAKKNDIHSPVWMLDGEREATPHDIWYNMIQLLPSSYNQKRTLMFSYENLASMYRARKNHKLDEWREFCKWMEGLPYSEIITGEKKNAE